MKKAILLSAILLASCDGGGSSDKKPAEPEVVVLPVTQSNTCETAVDFDGSIVVAETPGEIWLNYTGKTDQLQLSTCSSGQNAVFEVYHNCDWYNFDYGTINGRGEQSLQNCYPGTYGDVLGIREVDVKVRIVPAANVAVPYSINFDEIGY